MSDLPELSDGPITREEMVEMFGEEYPDEVARLIRTVPGETTFRELRRMIREVGEKRRAIAGAKGRPKEVDHQRWTIERPEFELMAMASHADPRPLITIKALDDAASHASVRIFYRVDPPAPGISELYLSVLEVVPLMRGNWMVCGSPPCRFEDIRAVNVELMVCVNRYDRLVPPGGASGAQHG